MGGGGAAVWVLHPFPQLTSAVSGSCPYAILQPLLHQRGCAQGGHPRLSCQGCCGASSTFFSGLLQPSVCRVEDLGVVASGHRPLPPQSLCGCVPLSDGDHPVCSPVGSSGRLDGLHRLERSVPTGSGTSGFSSSSTLCGLGSHFPIQSSVLWPLHGSTGLLTGHGSYFRHSPLYGYPHAQVSRRLASPVVLSGIPPPGSPDCPRALPRAGGCDQPGEIPPRTIPGGAVSRCRDQHPVFCGFSIARSHLQAAVNRRRISILRLASREVMALAAGHAFFAGSPSSWRQTADAVSPVVSQSILGSRRSLGSGVLDSVLSSRSPVVAPPASPLPGCIPLPSLTRPRLLVRRLGRRVGCSSGSPGRFRPLGLPQASMSINARELLAIQHGLHRFQLSLRGHTVAVYCDNVTAVAYLRKEGGTRSPSLNTIAQEILRWAESLDIRLAPQFIPGSNNVLADALSRPHQLPHSEWSLNMTVFQSLCRLWPVQIDLFATSANHRCSIYFSPYRDPQAAGTDAFLQSWDGLQAYAFPPFAIIPRVLAKLRESRGTELTLVAPYWAQRPWFPDLLQLSLAPPVILPDRLDLLLLPRSRLRYPDLHRLRLHAWRLSGGSPELQDSPQQ